MSTTRNLLILVLTLLCLSLSAAPQFILHQENGWQQIKDQDKTYFTRLDLNLELPLSKEITFSFSDYLYWHDAELSKQQQRFSNRILAAMQFRSKYIAVKTGYQGSQLDNSSPIYIFFDPEDFPFYQYQRRAIHQGFASLRLGDEDISFSVYNIARRTQSDLHYPFGFERENIKDYRDDYYSGGSFRMQMGEHLALNAGYDRSIHPHNVAYDIQSRELGAELGYQLKPLLFVSAACTWQNRTGSNLAPILKNQFISSMELSAHLLPELYTSLSYLNRSVYDQKQEQGFLLSELYQASIKYALNYDPSAMSHITLGTRMRPANKSALHPDTSAYFAETDLKLLPAIYLGAEYTGLPDFYTQWGVRASYSFARYSDVQLKYLLSEQAQRLGSEESSQLILGTNLRF